VISKTRKLEWNDGMSVGVESIDNDHKQLLSLIAQISEAIDNSSATEVIGDVFNKLEDYVAQHFSREEALMRSCNYKGLEQHINKHRMFVEKVGQLKSWLLTADTLEIAEEINLFLVDWLINHIVVEDMHFAQTAYDHGLATSVGEEKKNLLDRLSLWLGRWLVLPWRVLMTSLLPILGMLFLSLFIIWDSYNQLREMEALQGIFHVIHEVSELNHSLQAERGLTSGLISSGYRQFSSALAERRQISDAAAEKFMFQIDSLSPEIVSEELAANIDITTVQLSKLNEQRELVDNRNSSIVKTLAFYTTLNASLRDLPDGMSQIQMDSDLANNIVAFTSIMHLKEAVGQERALGMKMIEQGQFAGKDFQSFVALIGEQQGFLQVFLHTATPEQSANWQQLIGGGTEESVKELEMQFYQTFDTEELVTVDSQVWFDTLSYKMDLLKLQVDQLVRDIEINANNKVVILNRTLYFTSTFLIVLLLLAVFSSRLLTHSIIYPVSRITHAMTRLSKGDRDIRFTDRFARDELGEMVRAYESCRRSLLQGDLASAIVYRRKEVELQRKVQEKEHYKELASTDPLTGAFNRRKFNDLANGELERISRYNRPLSVMMLDLDHFKSINDNYGHASGDTVLKEFHKTCQSRVRNSDIIARIGGEEFSILMPETGLEQAKLLAERIREAVSEISVKVDNDIIRLTVSIGVTEWSGECFQEFNDMLEYADQALYEAKNSGRNRVIAYSKMENEKSVKEDEASSN
jgi:diguanylate cyclase (GGDEF)-like protein/hemerythrin-like metal-binding protein